MKAIQSFARILAINAIFIVACIGLLLLAGGVALKFDTASAFIVVGVIILLDSKIEEWGGDRVFANGIVQMLAPQATYGPADDYWYQPVGVTAGSGMVVTPETALKISAFYACLKVLGETVLSAPLPVYRSLANGDRERAPEHPLWRILHDDYPNDDQTSGEWLETHLVHAAMRGTSYSELIPGDHGPITAVHYLHPDRVKPERLPSGILRYKVRDQNTGIDRIVNADRIFRLPGLSSNGVTGISVLEYARETLGISLALQSYAGRSFSQGVRTSGVLEYPGKFADKEAAERLRRQWQEVYAGAANSGKTVILEEGMVYKAVSMTNEDAQMLASEQWQVADIARWFRVPLIMIDEHEKNTSWGTGIEQQMLGFIVFTMLPWFIRIERRVNKQLINPLGVPGDYFSEFIIENLLRGDIKSRFEAYQIAAGGAAPWMNRNEIRRRENLNQGAAELDVFLRPANMVPTDTPVASSGQANLPSGPGANVDPRLRGYAEVLVGQIVRKESEAIRKAAVRYASDGAGWESWASEFYDGIADDLDERRMLTPEQAETYAREQRARLVEGGAAAAEANEASRVEMLLNLVLEATR